MQLNNDVTIRIGFKSEFLIFREFLLTSVPLYNKHLFCDNGIIVDRSQFKRNTYRVMLFEYALNFINRNGIIFSCNEFPFPILLDQNSLI